MPKWPIDQLRKTQSCAGASQALGMFAQGITLCLFSSFSTLNHGPKLKGDARLVLDGGLSCEKRVASGPARHEKQSSEARCDTMFDTREMRYWSLERCKKARLRF